MADDYYNEETIEDQFGDDEVAVIVRAWMDYGNYDEDDDERDGKERVEVDVEVVNGVSYGESKELLGILQDMAEEEYDKVMTVEEDEELPEDPLSLVYDALAFETKRWLYWRFGVDPGGAMKKWEKEQEQKEIERKRLEEENLKKKLEQKTKSQGTKSNRIAIHQAVRKETQLKARLAAQQAALLSRANILRMQADAKTARKALEDYKNLQYQKSRSDALTYAVSVLYGEDKRPDPKEYQFSGDNLLEEMEIAYGADHTIFNFTFKKATKVPFIMQHLTNLTELNMCYNELTKIPPEIAYLTNLQRLILSENKIVEFEHLDNLVKLTNINLRGNKVLFVPETVSTLTNLRVLELDNNKIKLLPEKIGQLRKLTYLSLEFNHLSYVPPEIGTLTTLEHLRLRNNPVRMIPSDVYQKGVVEVLKFLREYIPELAGVAASTLLSDFKEYFNNPEFSDITFDVGGKFYFAHKCLLSVRCPSLLQLLGSKGVNVETTRTFAMDVKPDVMEQFLQFVYTDYNDIDVEKYSRAGFLEELMSMAQFHNLPRLVNICEQYYNYKKIILEAVPAGTFAQDFANYYKDEKRRSMFCDITLVAEDKEAQVHKVFLAARCPYFKTMFSSGLKEAQESVIHLQNCERFDVLERILEFIYSDDVENITEETIIDLLTTSHSFELKRLKSIAENVCGYSLDVENVGCLLDVAVLYSCETLKRACMFFVLRDYNKVRGTDAWKNMTEEAVEAVRSQAEEWGVQWDI